MKGQYPAVIYAFAAVLSLAMATVGAVFIVVLLLTLPPRDAEVVGALMIGGSITVGGFYAWRKCRAMAVAAMPGPGLCGACGYDLRGSHRSGPIKCPECGTTHTIPAEEIDA